jgi:hypothetical protein
MTCGQARPPLTAGASAQEIAAEVVVAAQPAAELKKLAPLSSADPSPPSAAARAAAFAGHVLGTLSGWNCEISRSP